MAGYRRLWLKKNLTYCPELVDHYNVKTGRKRVDWVKKEISRKRLKAKRKTPLHGPTIGDHV
jgi:hypothetical protein